MAFILIMSTIAGVYYESVIRKYYPDYSAILFVSAILCATGLIYALVMRNIMIALLALLGTAAIPFLVDWIRLYWPIVCQKFIILNQ